MAKPEKESPNSLETIKYQPKPEEFAAVEAIAARRKARPPTQKIKVGRKDGQTSVAIDHIDKDTGWLMMISALGTTDYTFADGLIAQVVNAGTQGKNIDGHGPNFMLSVIQAIAPKDELEAMIAAQMAAVHMATMMFARRLAHVDNIPQQDSASNAFNKLARTFAAQMEALKRYRTGGEQKVTVKHVTVNDGGQAIVGAVSTAPGGVGRGEKG